MTFFLGFRGWKMDAEVLFEVKAVGRDLRMVRGLHFFNRDTIENFQITRGKIFQTLSQTISGGECFFAFSWLFKLTSLYMVISIMCIKKRVSKFMQFFAFLWLFKLTSLFMDRFSKKFGYPTFYYLLVKLLLKNSKMALFLTYLLREKS